MAEHSPAPFRVETDSLGEVRVPADRLWGAQTQRSLENFPIGVARFRWGRGVIRAFGLLKKCAALANGELGQLPPEKVSLIVRASEEVAAGVGSIAPGFHVGASFGGRATRTRFFFPGAAFGISYEQTFPDDDATLHFLKVGFRVAFDIDF